MATNVNMIQRMAADNAQGADEGHGVPVEKETNPHSKFLGVKL